VTLVPREVPKTDPSSAFDEPRASRTPVPVAIPGGAGAYIRKMWNVCRFIRIRYGPGERHPRPRVEDPLDRWFFHLLNIRLLDIDDLLYRRRYVEAGRILHPILVKEFSRWYLEFVKAEGDTAQSVRFRKQNLLVIFDCLLRMSAPLFPSACDQIAANLYGCSLPPPAPADSSGYRGNWIFPREYREIESLKQWIRLIRRAAHLQNLPSLHGRRVTLRVRDRETGKMLDRYRSRLLDMTRAREVLITTVRHASDHSTGQSGDDRSGWGVRIEPSRDQVWE